MKIGTGIRHDKNTRLQYDTRKWDVLQKFFLSSVSTGQIKVLVAVYIELMSSVSEHHLTLAVIYSEVPDSSEWLYCTASAKGEAFAVGSTTREGARVMGVMEGRPLDATFAKKLHMGIGVF